MINAKTVEELCKRLEDACTGHPHAKIAWPHRLLHEAAARIRTLAAENEALRRERNEATSCAACGGPYPNADCGHARNAADVFQPAPCRPDTARAESSESLVVELREKVERLMKALEDIYRVGDGYNEHRPEDGKYAGTTGEGHARCREIAYRARTTLEGRDDE